MTAEDYDLYPVRGENKMALQPLSRDVCGGCKLFEKACHKCEARKVAAIAAYVYQGVPKERDDVPAR